MKRIDLSLDWYRRIGDKNNRMFGPMSTKEGAKPKPFVFGPHRPEEIPDNAEPVQLPDDFILDIERTPDAVSGGSNAFYPGEMARYWRNLHIDESLAGKKLLLDVDGSYMNTEVRINGMMTEHHPYGYTPWQFDLTPYVKSGDNLLRVDVQSRQPSSRWYSGGGIFRAVGLLVGGKICVNPWDLFVTTPEVGPVSTVHVSAQIENAYEADKDVSVTVAICPRGGENVKTAEYPVRLKSGCKTAFEADITLENALLWSCEEPNLYELKLTITSGGKEEDTAGTTFGIRKIEIDAENGFRLNGVPMKLYGGCVHHDNGALGARSLRAAEERKIKAMKQVGYNAIRTAHNPASAVLLDVCDEMGMLVLEETFDCWTEGKNMLDYHLYFNDWWERDTKAMVLRGRNHPCIWCYSVGNEIPETRKEYGAKYAKMQYDCMKSADPTRPVMTAFNGMAKITSDTVSCSVDDFGNTEFDLQTSKDHYPAAVLPGESDPWGDSTAATAAVFELVGQNYMHRRLAHDGAKYPGRVIATTESKPTDTYDAWNVVWQNAHVIGDFVWTAFDNLGEAGMGQILKHETKGVAPRAGWPWLSCCQGDFDISFERKPQSYYRALVWGVDKGTHLYSNPPEWGVGHPYGNGWGWEAVLPTWNYHESWLGDPSRCVAYTIGDEAEFILNGKTVGKVPVVHYCAECAVPYQPGKLEVIAYEKGEKVGYDCIETIGDAAAIELGFDKEAIKADGFDLAYVDITLVDAQGRRVYHQSKDINVTVSGAGVLEGLGSGNPCTDENYNTGHRKTFKGRIQAIVRSNARAGCIQLTAAVDGLPSRTITLSAE